MPCAPTLKVSTYAAVSEVIRVTAGFALVRSSLYTMYIALYQFVQTLYHVIYFNVAHHTQKRIPMKLNLLCKNLISFLYSGIKGAVLYFVDFSF